VADPVMIAKGGHALLQAEAIETLKRRLLPLAT
jgi:hydroxymethylpyrimidine/phosphomethylpyrimidine kinase